MIKLTIQELLDELDRFPETEYEIDRYIFPLFNRMLNQHNFMFAIKTQTEKSVRCHIVKTSKPEKEMSK